MPQPGGGEAAVHRLGSRSEHGPLPIQAAAPHQGHGGTGRAAEPPRPGEVRTRSIDRAVATGAAAPGMAGCAQPGVGGRAARPQPRSGLRRCQLLSPVPAHATRAPRLSSLSGHGLRGAGGGEVRRQLEEELSASDWDLSLEACLGVCGQAPLLLLDGVLVGRLPSHDRTAVRSELQRRGLPLRFGGRTP